MPNFKIIGGDGKQYGPVSETELRQWMSEGRLNAQSLAQVEGTDDWKPLGTFLIFAAAPSSLGAPPPPLAATPENKAAWTNEILACEPDLRFGECLATGFKFLGSNPGFVLGAVFIAWFLNAVMTLLPLIGGILHLLFSGVITGGLYVACVRRMRHEPSQISDVFEGFKTSLGQLILAGAISRVLIQFGFFFCLLPGIYLLVAWFFALPLVADKRLEFWSAMELSRKIVTRVWFQVGLLLFITFLPALGAQFLFAKNLVGFLMEIMRDSNFDPMKLFTSLQHSQGELTRMVLVWQGILQGVLFFNLLFAIGVVMRAYENLFGARKA